MTRPEDRGAGTADRPLTDAQERALIRLDENWHHCLDGNARQTWMVKPCRDDRTLMKLQGRALAATRRTAPPRSADPVRPTAFAGSPCTAARTGRIIRGGLSGLGGRSSCCSPGETTT